MSFCNTDNTTTTATTADPDVHRTTACTLAVSLISFCFHHHQIGGNHQPLFDVYDELLASSNDDDDDNVQEGSSVTLDLIDACCRTILELAQVVPEAVRAASEERQEWMELLTQYYDHGGSSVLWRNPSTNEACKAARMALGAFDNDDVGVASKNVVVASGAHSATVAVVLEAVDWGSTAVPPPATVPVVTATTESNTIQQPPSSLMELKFDRNKKMDPGVLNDACNIATKLVSFFGAYLPKVSCNDLDHTFIYKRLYADQDFTKETKALQMACCRKICIAMKRAPGTFQRHKSLYKHVVWQWVCSDNCDADLKLEASKAIAALNSSPPSPPGPPPVDTGSSSTNGVKRGTTKHNTAVSYSNKSPAVEMTPPPALGGTRVMRSLRSKTKEEVEKSYSRTSANTPGDGTTKMSLRGTTIYSAPSVDTTMVENAAGYLVLNSQSVESTKPVENVIVDSGNNKMVRTKRTRAQSRAAVRSSDKLVAAVQKLIEMPSSLEKRKCGKSSKMLCREDYYKIADKEPRKVPPIIDRTGRSALQGLNHNDVVFGRGTGVSNFSGNQAFFCLVWNYRPTYCNTGRRMGRAGIASRVVGEVMRQQPPGRFVEMIDGDYFIVPYERAVEKASQALRELKLQPLQTIELLPTTTKKRKTVSASEARHPDEAPKKARIKRTIPEKAAYENTRQAAMKSSDKLVAAVQKLIEIPSSPEKRKDKSSKMLCREDYYKIADKEPRKVPPIIDRTGRSALQGLNHNDVVFGRGTGVSSFSGNQAFRCLVWNYKAMYRNSGWSKRFGIACQLVGGVMRQKPPGRFVDKIDDEYFIVPFERAVEKASQALRENLQPQQRIERHQKETKTRKTVPAYGARHTYKEPEKARTKRTLSDKTAYESTSEENSLQLETRTSTRPSQPVTAARVHEQINGADAVELLESSPCPAADVLAVSPSPSVWYVRPPPEQELGYVPPKLPYPISTSMNYFLQLRLAEMEIVRNQQV